MEALTMFASTVGLIGAIHLFDCAVERLGKGKYDRGNREGKRVDWYCFFQPSDLLGTESIDQETREQPDVTDAQQLEQQQRRQQAHRRRLQV